MGAYPTPTGNLAPAGWWHFVSPARVIFGEGCSRFVGDAARQYGTRALVCTDDNLVGAGVVGPIARQLEKAGLAVVVFDGGRAEISIDDAEACVESVRAFAPDVVVGLGGGSNLDLAKVTAARLVTDHPIASWVAEGVPVRALPLVAMPTTAGTGSEVTPIAVLTDDALATKVGFSNRGLLARTVLVDPCLTFSCPPAVTAHSGLDALTHAIEAFLAIDFSAKPLEGYDFQGFVGKNPLSDVLALRAAELLAANLARAVREGDNATARSSMALGSLLAGMAFASAGTAVVHALQYPIGARTKTPHGLGNATLLPAAIRYNLGAHPDHERALARAVAGRPTAEPEELPELVADLVSEVGIVPNLRSLGVSARDLPTMATAAARIERLISNNPRPLDEAALLAVLNIALDFGSSTATEVPARQL